MPLCVRVQVQAVHPGSSGVDYLVLAHAVVDEARHTGDSNVSADLLICIPASLSELSAAGLGLNDFEPAAICSVGVHCTATERAPADDEQATRAHIAH
jgi:hypothetical protein